MKNKKSKAFFVLLTIIMFQGFIQAQNTYLLHPFYGDNISFWGGSMQYVNTHDVYRNTKKPLDYEFHGYSFGLVFNNNNLWNGIGVLWSIYWNLNLSFPENSLYKIYAIESSIYHQLHASFKLPLSNDFAIGLHAGPGLAFGIFHTDLSTEEEFRAYKEKWYKRLDFSFDYAFYIEYRKTRFEITWARGLRNNGEDANPFHRNRLMAGLVFFSYK